VADEGLSWDGKQEALAYATREQSPSNYLALVVRGTLDCCMRAVEGGEPRELKLHR
jgi:hypothetical protein